MKVDLVEHDGCYGIDLKAETLEDAALLVRFGINFTKEVRCAGTHASSNGEITSYVVLGKSKKPDSAIPHK